MDKIEKNRLDLAYQRQLCFLSFVLTIGIGSVISLIIGIIFSPENWFKYSILSLVIGSLAYTFYYKIDENLKKISNKIKKLKNKNLY